MLMVNRANEKKAMNLSMKRPSGIMVKVTNCVEKEPSAFNLDLCARKFVETSDVAGILLQHGIIKETNTHHDLGGKRKQREYNSSFPNDQYFDSNVHQSYNMQSDVNTNSSAMNLYTSESLNRDNMLKTEEWKFNNITDTNDNGSVADFLESRIRKVHENNRQILRNISALNEALDCTIKKEMLNKLYPKNTSENSSSGGYDNSTYEIGLQRHHPSKGIGNVLGWQTVWMCNTCYQVWPRKELLHQHSENCFPHSETEMGREIKASLLMCCEFCEKVFTNIAHILRHSSTHNTTRNYECGVCNVGLLSYSEADQHWRGCAWLRSSYHFNLPKMRPCNMCDKIFRGYQQLYEHRYATGHFYLKIHYEAAMEVSVYQCELCAASFHSVSRLLSHRHGSHPVCVIQAVASVTLQ